MAVSHMDIRRWAVSENFVFGILAKRHLKNHMGEGTFQKRPFLVAQRMIIIRINAAED